MSDVKTLRVRAVIAYNDDGNFIIHGSDAETPEAMAKAIQPIWQHDPSQENIDYIEFDVLVPVVALRPQAQVLAFKDGETLAGEENNGNS